MKVSLIVPVIFYPSNDHMVMFLSLWLIGRLHCSVFLYCTILAFLKRSLLDPGRECLLYVLGFCLQIFYGIVLPQCSSWKLFWIPFSWWIFVCFISLNVAPEIEFGNISSIFIHWNSLKIVGISTFLKLWKSSALKLFELLLFVLGSILMTVSISLGVIRLLYHFSDLNWVWIIAVCLESHLDYPFFWSIGFWN